MKDGIEDKLVPCDALCYQPLTERTSATMTVDEAQHKPGERIAKVIARAGLASRREAEEWIAAGRVAVNDTVIGSPALNVTARDRISIDGEPLPAPERTRLFLYHKPRGLMTTRADPQGRSTIFDKLPVDLPRLVSVGRLDFNTEGLLLLTNDGALARVLELPATGWLRRYRVRAHGAVTQDKLDALRGGVTIGGIRYGSIEAALERVQGSNLWLTFAIREGKNREVRNVLGELGLTVTRLIRVSFGPFQLAELAEGAVEEVRTRVLREQLGERLAALAGADFSAPVAVPRPSKKMEAPTPRVERPTSVEQTTRIERPPRGERRNRIEPPKSGGGAPAQKAKHRKTIHHAWRARDEERPKKPLWRKFRGARRDDGERQEPAGDKRAGLLTDRKGRRVPVERFGQPPVKEAPRESAPQRERHGRRRAPDRASGARPRQPRGRR
jgi:23S rRNA pseudouridine2605 synthase